MATLRVASKPPVAPMKVAQISKPETDFEIVERDIPEPDSGHVRIKVQACGVCHSDVLTKEGLWPGIQYPRVPGHEVVGTVDEVGAGRIEEHRLVRRNVGVPVWRAFGERRMEDERRRFLLDLESTGRRG